MDHTTGTDAQHARAKSACRCPASCRNNDKLCTYSIEEFPGSRTCASVQAYRNWSTQDREEGVTRHKIHVAIRTHLAVGWTHVFVLHGYIRSYQRQVFHRLMSRSWKIRETEIAYHRNSKSLEPH